MTIYFARYFAEFINFNRDDKYLSNLAIPELLRQKLRTLEKISNELKLESINNDEEYKRLIQESEAL